MDDRSNGLVPNADSAEIARRIRMHTPARLLVGRAGAAYRTETQLQLREDHAKARDAVRAELELKTAFTSEFIESGNSLKLVRGRPPNWNIWRVRLSDGNSATSRAQKS